MKLSPLFSIVLGMNLILSFFFPIPFIALAFIAFFASFFSYKEVVLLMLIDVCSTYVGMIRGILFLLDVLPWWAVVFGMILYTACTPLNALWLMTLGNIMDRKFKLRKRVGKIIVN